MVPGSARVEHDVHLKGRTFRRAEPARQGLGEGAREDHQLGSLLTRHDRVTVEGLGEVGLDASKELGILGRTQGDLGVQHLDLAILDARIGLGWWSGALVVEQGQVAQVLGTERDIVVAHAQALVGVRIGRAIGIEGDRVEHQQDLLFLGAGGGTKGQGGQEQEGVEA